MENAFQGHLWGTDSPLCMMSPSPRLPGGHQETKLEWESSPSMAKYRPNPEKMVNLTGCSWVKRKEYFLYGVASCKPASQWSGQRPSGEPCTGKGDGDILHLLNWVHLQTWLGAFFQPSDSLRLLAWSWASSTRGKLDWKRRGSITGLKTFWEGVIFRLVILSHLFTDHSWTDTQRL